VRAWRFRTDPLESPPDVAGEPRRHSGERTGEVHVVRSLRSLTCALGVLVGLAVPGMAQAAPTELFFSEYIEGSSNNKALEIYNGTAAPIDLAASGYSVQMFSNGGTTASV